MLFLPLTIQPEEQCADFSTSYLHTSGKCLLLNYLLLYPSCFNGILSVYLLNENLDFTLLKTIDLKNLPSESLLKWQMLLIKLPYSRKLQKIYINFVRTANKKNCIAIDDFSIQPCNSLRKYFLCQAQIKAFIYYKQKSVLSAQCILINAE